MELETTLEVAALLRAARHVCVLTGAGISAESGVPTFRGAQTGLWARYDPLELATPEAFARDPALVWRWYRWRRGLVAEARPNPGHLAIAALGKRVSCLTLVTQNVDRLHQRAGSADVIEFHGNLFESRCSAEGIACDARDDEPVPSCSGCGAPARPAVVWFGEAIPEAQLAAAIQAAATADVFLSIGTSSLVYPAAGLVDLARGAGAATVEINTEPAGAGFDYVLRGKAGTVLPKLVESLGQGTDDGQERIP